MRLSPPRVAVRLAIALVVGAVASPVSADRSRGEVVLTEEIVESGATPAIPCGRLGPQPRDVVARVIAIERDVSRASGPFASPGDLVRLRWRTCHSLPGDGVSPGRRFRIWVRRRGHDAQRRYLVRRGEPL